MEEKYRIAENDLDELLTSVVKVGLDKTYDVIMERARKGIELGALNLDIIYMDLRDDVLEKAIQCDTDDHGDVERIKLKLELLKITVILRKAAQELNKLYRDVRQNEDVRFLRMTSFNEAIIDWPTKE